MTLSLLGLSGPDFMLQIAIFCGGLFVSCMVCHGELARLKPHPNHLTSFYLMLSIGGAIGGVFTVFIAPNFFNGDYELPIGMAATAVLALAVVYKKPTLRRYRIAGTAAWLTMTAVTVTLLSGLTYGSVNVFNGSKLMARNFYGTLRIYDHGKDEQSKRTLVHGTITHGEEYLAPERRRWPTAYYGEHSGVGMAILASRNAGPQRVGVVGLGAGTLAAYGRRGDYYRFYEINPLVVRLARSEFTFLTDCPATTAVTLGDARQSLEREQAQGFDVLVVDAFSGDSIPVHLLTREAFAIYFRNLKPGGILAVHVTNHYLDLPPVVKLAADQYGKVARIVKMDLNGRSDAKDEYPSSWVLISDGPDIFTRTEFRGATEEISPSRNMQPWTDDYSSIYAILKRGQN
jgi:SAM-dependent methyltransferase